MVQSRKISIAFLLVILIGWGCKPSNSKPMMDTINAHKVESNEGWKNAKDIDTTNCIAFDLRFLNNPYQFKEGNGVLLYLDEITIYKGVFKNKVRAYVPKDYFGRRLIPGMQIYKSNSEYNFIHKTSMFLGENDRFLYVVFCPDNDITGSCYLFSQREKL